MSLQLGGGSQWICNYYQRFSITTFPFPLPKAFNLFSVTLVEHRETDSTEAASRKSQMSWGRLLIKHVAQFIWLTQMSCCVSIH